MRLALIGSSTIIVAFGALYILTLASPQARALIDKQFIFFPEKELRGSPAQLGLSFEDVEFQAGDGVRLHGWFVPGDGDITWIWFHGNAGNISDRLENLMLLHNHLGANIFLFDYRGYGRSGGRASEEGTYRDARGALDYVRSRQEVNPAKIVYFGRSLGAAVAAWLATQHSPHGLILESPFTSVKDMAKRAYPGLPLYLLVRTKYDSLARIGDVTCPVLVLHGDRDETVPFSHGKKLFDAANEPKRFYSIAGAGHNDTYIAGQEPYFRAMADFLKSLDS